MDFSEALKLLKRGEILRRKGWATKGAAIMMEDIQGYAACICWCVPGRAPQPGWLCSMGDMMAEDWELVRASDNPEPHEL